jgi:hypothetical protein
MPVTYMCSVTGHRQGSSSDTINDKIDGNVLHKDIQLETIVYNDKLLFSII